MIGRNTNLFLVTGVGSRPSEGVVEEGKVTIQPGVNKEVGKMKKRKRPTSLLDLKRVARLSMQDRKQFVKILKRTNKRKGSNNSKGHDDKESLKGDSLSFESYSLVNKDKWRHWMYLHGGKKVVNEDEDNFGKSVRVNFTGECSNMFSVLSRGGRGQKMRRG